ncbi:hypothetical protein [Flavobacterium collinsii]|uniref:Receptor L-domain domain-containing protein n=1 Tax=Flavobacterium collinsii TaxID=1114861 RepID=A0ABN7EI62_9FLAO|nr:hypothetical protein [Flavobacterium collinsii]CAA9197577.1 hypothetical protein FLACOL7796_01732 [Flavobacterium collinsii]
MKKITLVLLLLSSFTILFAQAPQKMSYQSVIRKADGTLVTGTLVSIKTSILVGSASGTTSYVETQTTTTNSNGLATIEIGGGTAITGTFSGINWGAGSHFIKTEIDPTGGTNYTISGTSQLLSVPYALYAGSSQSKGRTSLIIAGDITDAQAAAQVAAELGPETENIYIMNTTNLTTLDLSAAKRLVDLSIKSNSNLVSVNLSNLSDVYNALYVEGNARLSSISFPVLKTVLASEIYFSGNSALQSVSFPLLTKTKTIYISGNAFLSYIDLPVFSSFYSNLYSFQVSRNALPSYHINSLLSKLLNVSPASGKFIDLSGQTPPAPPTGQGIIDKATIKMNNSISTD